MDTLLHDINLFYEMLNCCHNLPVYQYGEDYQLRYEVPGEPSYARMLYSVEDSHEFISSFAEDHHCPLIMSNDIGVTWIIAFKKAAGELQGIFIIGPFFTDDLAVSAIKNKLMEKGLTLSQCAKAVSDFSEFPVISLVKALEYAVMFHYCINREKIFIHNIHFRNNREIQQGNNIVVDSHGTWAVEQSLLQMVSDGNLNYQKEMSHLATSGASGNLANNDPLRHIKNQVIIFISLCCRAAVKGGMNVELAYSLADQYIRNVESAKTVAECSEINSTMLDNYINRVHKYKISLVSAPIKAVCDYIDINLVKNPTLDELASFSNYSKYYLSKKFKQEIGETVTDYMNKLRIERSKELLQNTTLSIHAIGEQLGFCSSSYFAECFRKYTGCSPADFRS